MFVSVQFKLEFENKEDREAHPQGWVCMELLSMQRGTLSRR